MRKERTGTNAHKPIWNGAHTKHAHSHAPEATRANINTDRAVGNEQQ